MKIEIEVDEDIAAMLKALAKGWSTDKWPVRGAGEAAELILLDALRIWREGNSPAQKKAAKKKPHQIGILDGD